jgi:hypothetical protein
MKHQVMALLLAAAGAAYGADLEFDHVVKAIENHYGVKRTHVPLMGIANLFVKVARPAGAKGFKLAIFQDLRSFSDSSDTVELDRFMDEICRGGMHALVVTHSRRDGESSYILAGEVGKSTKMLIATFERNEATVVQVEVDFTTLLKAIGSPGETRRLYRADLRDRDER